MKFRLFGRSGLRVSEICLGTMTFGTEWGWGSDYEESRQVFEAYAAAGGNFVDTANRYTEGTSEKWLGDFIHAERHHFVLATKYTLHDRLGDPNYAGSHRKNMMRSVEESLRRLNTEFIDLLWVHAWDFYTPAEEVMRGLDDLVRSGKVHYIGISDTPAWIVARCNTMAELRGWSQFVGLQVEYSLLQRTPERDLLPMAQAYGMAVTPWGPLAGGALTGKYVAGEPGRVKPESPRRSECANNIASLVVELAAQIGCTPAQLALAWCMQQPFTSIPIVGARRPEQLTDSLKAVTIAIPEEVLAKLNNATAPELGFPHDFLNSHDVKRVVYAGTYGDIQP
jgi:aryl-alcohol dehydrogenase-like predicted oxidoreductase